MNGDIGVIKSIETNEDNDTYVIVSYDDNDVLYDKQDQMRLIQLMQFQFINHKVVSIKL